MINLETINKIHILKRVKQGREKDRPEVHLSRNHNEDCNCNHVIIRPNGNVYKSPCEKWKLKN